MEIFVFFYHFFISLGVCPVIRLNTVTDMLIKDIAAMCGFENEYYFSNFIKKQTGMNPSAFRI